MSQGPDSKRDSFLDAFAKVDEMVSKPVLGSDGANSWQQFRKGNKAINNHKSVAPKAPLKKSDMLGTGFSSWEEERKHEDQMRQAKGQTSTGSGYTTFKKKNTVEEAAERKRIKLIEARIRPDDKKYFIPSPTFEGWKYNYVFTTKVDQGTGYYWDGMDAIKELKGELVWPKKKVEKATSETRDETEQAPKKKKRKKNRGPTIVSDPNNPMEQVHAILQQRRQAASGLIADLPPGWAASIDPSSKKPYYYNQATGERSWTKPENVDKAQSTASDELPKGWKSAVDKSTGKTYYYNDKGETKWEKPTAAC
ncbi:unnamed protein product [Cylindrotheca closterium]|uniref:WW domain-containing protein n=1 Tax=Cylindrotheca closterium TaxID=2856 RepID=A0AAD2PXM3_9STRA|nr:unnamed protein product [Cylindrotheca closterium]